MLQQTETGDAKENPENIKRNKIMEFVTKITNDICVFFLSRVKFSRINANNCPSVKFAEFRLESLHKTAGVSLYLHKNWQFVQNIIHSQFFAKSVAIFMFLAPQVF